MVRKIRSDCRLGTAAKKYGLNLEGFRHKGNNRKMRKDMKVGTFRKLGK